MATVADTSVELEDEGLEGDDAPEGEVPVTVEEEARAMGWHPLEEYRGDPRRWTSAEEFVRRGREQLPILRDQNRRMAERLARQEPMLAEIPALREAFTSVKQGMDDMRKLAHRSDERGYQRALAELKSQRREAVESGDTAAFDRVDQQIDVLETERAEVAPAPAREPAPAPVPAAAPAAPAPEPEIAQFIRDNAEWWNVDAALTQAMINAHSTVKVRHPSMRLADQLAEAKKRVVADFPERFPAGDEFEEEDDPMPAPRAPARQAAPASRPSPPVPARRTTDPWVTAIPDATERAGAQAAFANMKRHQEDLTVTEYLTLYADPHADVLAIRRAAKRK